MCVAGGRKRRTSSLWVRGAARAPGSDASATPGGHVHRPVLLDDHGHHHAPEGQFREPLLRAQRGGDVDLLVLGAAGDELVARGQAVRCLLYTSDAADE